MRIVLQLNSPARAAVPKIKAPPFFSSTNLSRGYFPSGGVVYSLLVHELAFIGLLYLPIANNLLRIHYPIVRAVQAHMEEPPVVMWLPVLNDGGPGTPLPAAKSEARPKETAAASRPNKEGLSYPGPQPILSDPPNPTNFIQTLQVPALENPPILRPPLLLPNFVLTKPEPAFRPPPVVKPAEPEPVRTPTVSTAKPNSLPLPPAKPAVPAQTDKPELIAPEPAFRPPPVVKPAEPEPVRTPTVSSANPNALPLPPAKPAVPAQTSKPKLTPPERAIPVPNAASPAPKARISQPAMPPGAPAKTIDALNESGNQDLSQMTVRVADLQNILALTPMPAQLATPVPIPAGEARGRFAVSPQPNLTAATTEPGFKAESSSAAAGTNNPPVVSVTFGSKGNTASAAAAGTGANAGATKAKDAANAVAGPGNGSGSGSGVGPKEGPFAGITVVGGVRDPGAAANSALNPPAPRRPLQTSFGITVISTEGSGGGLPAFGVFGQRQVYTVFLDMRETETDTNPSWTLEFAVLSDSGTQASAAGDPSRNQQGLVLPFPAVKEQPPLPAEAVARNLGAMVIVYAVINVEGKMEQISVKQSPDPMLIEPMINALSKWIFRPARLNGEPVRAQVLMGIPLWLPD